MEMESCVWPAKSEFLHFVYCFSLCIGVSEQLDWMQFFTVTDIIVWHKELNDRNDESTKSNGTENWWNEDKGN